MSQEITTSCTIKVKIRYDYCPGGKGGTDSFGVPLEPDEPEDVEINEVLDAKTGVPVSPDKDELDSLADECLEAERMNIRENVKIPEPDDYFDIAADGMRWMG